MPSSSFQLVRRLRSVFVALAVLAAPSSAHAQAGDTVSATYTAAIDLYENGNVAGALALFRNAAEATADPHAQLYVGYCLARLGRRADAYRAFELVLTRIAERDEKYRPTREAAQAELAILDVHLAKIAIVVNDAPPDLAVTLDGAAVSEKTLGSSIVVEPGVHRVGAVASGSLPVWRDVEVEGGKLETLNLSLEKAVRGRWPRQPASETNPLRTAGCVSGAVGIAGFAVFAVTGLVAKNTLDGLERDAGGLARTETARLEEMNRGKSLQMVANVGLVVSAVGIAAGGTMYFLGGGRKKEGRGVWLSPGLGMVSCGGRF